ncbi:MAG: hypothetical protein Q8Q09_22395 [Deltaproteobacteria bacterium]|nr:hypothetical protein [Deltaproteobacteria bacterium]
MAGQTLGRALLTAAALCVVATQTPVAHAEWQAHGSGLRFFLPTQWPATLVSEGALARGPQGLALWVLPLSATQLSAIRTPEALFSAALTRPRVLSRTTSLTALAPAGAWSHGTATFERRGVHWFARAVQIDPQHGALAVAITPRATLTPDEAAQLDITLTSAFVTGTPGVVRYAGMSTMTLSGRVARSVSMPVVFELRGRGPQRTWVVPDLDDESCTYQALLRSDGVLRIEPDQVCQIARLGITTTLVGGQFTFAAGGATTSFAASGRLSFISRAMARGRRIAGSVSFNWRLEGVRAP